MEFRVRPRFLLACFAVLCSWLLPLTVGDDVDTSFVVGESVTLNCEIKDLDTEGSFVSWAKGSTTLFEDESIVPGAEDPTRYKVEKTEKKYTIVISGLTAEDDGAKFSCKQDDGDDIKSLESYRLKLKEEAPEVAPTQPPTMPAPPKVVVTEPAPVEEKEKDRKNDGAAGAGGSGGGGDNGGDEGTSNEIGEESDLSKGGGNGANSNASLSSAMATILLTICALSL